MVETILVTVTAVAKATEKEGASVAIFTVTDLPEGNSGGGSDTGLIVGIAVIGVLFALTLFGIAGFAIYKRRK